MTRLVALAVVLAAVPASAAPAPSFEGLLMSARRAVLETRAKQLRAKDARFTQDLTRLARDTESLSWDSRRLKDRLSDIRRRASRWSKAGRPPIPPIPPPNFPNDPRRPGDPARDQDPFLRMDLQRLTWDLRDHVRRAEDAGREGERLLREATKDPEHVAPAQDLERAARDFESEARWFESEARWAGMDLRRAGFTFEAFDVERGGSDASARAGALAMDARSLLDKVR